MGLYRKVVGSVQQRGVFGTVRTGAAYYVSGWLLPGERRARRRDRSFDSEFGVDTYGVIERDELRIDSADESYGQAYEQSKPKMFDELLGRLSVSHEDFVFVDIGSGKGRALLLASEFPFKRIIGIEFSEILHETAKENVRRYTSPSQKCLTFELHCMDACEYEFPSEPTVLYLYNPLAVEGMRRVLGRLARSLEANPREVFVLYAKPEHRQVAEELGFLPVTATRHYAVYRSSGKAAARR